ncbi:E3 ubiquitin-protein ligase SIN-like [Parasponia andersonii]|uniref:E3 ubiquitin-protein ligase SIN-like n=1 Tax=Parasponia andersonii TaxID=3476 RepID=A0A2P5CGA1_PARAD|nr:E3 ubiquitin-protein ligase SIN-like [Parasponia andersonii]
MRNRWGVTKFIDIDSFYDPSNGYLINDTCIFGAEVFIIKTTCKDECLTMLSQPELTCKYIWKFDDFWTKSGDKWYESDFFVGGDYKCSFYWFLQEDLFKPSVFADKGGKIGVGLELDSSTLSPNTSLLVNYLFRLRDQTESEKHYEIKDTEEFFSSSYIKDGIEQNTSGKLSFTIQVDNFMSLTKFKYPKLGALVNNTCILEVEIDVIAEKHPGDLYGGKLYRSKHA